MKSRYGHCSGMKIPEMARRFFAIALYLIKNNGGNYMGESRLHYGMSLRLYFEEKAFGPGMVMLLREVERTGSLQKQQRL